MFNMKANNVKVGDKLIDTQNRVWTVIKLCDNGEHFRCLSEEIDRYPWFFTCGCTIGQEYEIVGFAPGYGNQSTANKPHKHKDLIIAWANGAKIEYFHPLDNEWYSMSTSDWDKGTEYRIKPEPKPDVVKYMGFTLNTNEKYTEQSVLDDDAWMVGDWPNQLKLTFCGETGKLKAAGVIS